MEVIERNDILKKQEGCLNAPAEVVEQFELRNREFVRGQIGDEALIGQVSIAHEFDAGTLLIHLFAGLNDGGDIASVAEMVRSSDMELVIAAIFGIIGDEGGIIIGS